MTIEVVDYKQELNAKLIDSIIKRGYAVADVTGMVSSPEYLRVYSKDVVAIAEKEPSLSPKRYLFGLIKVNARRRIIATIWINGYREATHQRWVVETKGAEQLEEAKHLIDDIRKEFGATADLVLQDDQPRLETLFKDYDY